jgi:hypothetical protein
MFGLPEGVCLVGCAASERAEECEMTKFQVGEVIYVKITDEPVLVLPEPLQFVAAGTKILAPAFPITTVLVRRGTRTKEDGLQYVSDSLEECELETFGERIDRQLDMAKQLQARRGQIQAEGLGIEIGEKQRVQ